jgi:hypothetical protein
LNEFFRQAALSSCLFSLSVFFIEFPKDLILESSEIPRFSAITNGSPHFWLAFCFSSPVTSVVIPVMITGPSYSADVPHPYF